MAGKTDAPKMLGANGFKYREQFGVIVICKDEAEHKTVYERLAVAVSRLCLLTDSDSGSVVWLPC